VEIDLPDLSTTELQKNSHSDFYKEKKIEVLTEQTSLIN
jgi:hypothetical protein